MLPGGHVSALQSGRRVLHSRRRASSPMCSGWIRRGRSRATSSDGAAHESATGSDGSYRLALEPGTYTVTAVVEGTGPPIAEPVTVTVGSTMQRLDLQVDTGIR